MADVHGNYAALKTVLAEPELQTCDSLVFVGDAVMNGPYPKECLSRIMALGCDAVIGNTDLEVLVGNDPVAFWTREMAGIIWFAPRWVKEAQSTTYFKTMTCAPTGYSCGEMMQLFLELLKGFRETRSSTSPRCRRCTG